MPLKSLPRRNHHHSFGFLSAHTWICLMHVHVRRAKNIEQKIQVHDLHGVHTTTTTVVGPYTFAFARAWLYFLFRFIFHFDEFGLFCIDETVNELIMTNDRGFVEIAFGGAFRISLVHPVSFAALLLCVVRESDKYALAMPMFCIGSQYLINEECTFVICNGCEHIRSLAAASGQSHAAYCIKSKAKFITYIPQSFFSLSTACLRCLFMRNSLFFLP